MIKETVFIWDLVVQDVSLTQMHGGAVESVNASKLNSEACSDSMETVNEELTGNSKTTVVEIVCVTKCHFTLDLY